jgi:hypothetical protein
MKDIAAVKAAILAQEPKLAIVANPDKSPIPVEASLDEVFAEIKARMKLGLSFHPPVRLAAGDQYNGMQLILTDPPAPPGIAIAAKTQLVVQIYTDLSDPVAQTDQNFIGYAIQAAIVSEFMEDAIAERAAKQAAAIAAGGPAKTGPAAHLRVEDGGLV